MPLEPDLETPDRIEPCFLENAGGHLLDLMAELPADAGQLGARLHPKPAATRSLASLVRVMNCYYSNLIEGHNTRPRDIERALANDLDEDEGRRNLQIEARSHIRTQEATDAEAGALPDPASLAFILRLHSKFYRDAPEAMLRIEGAGRNFLMTPGALRNDPQHDVAVGRHVPPSSAAVARFMDYFAERYSAARMGPAISLTGDF